MQRIPFLVFVVAGLAACSSSSGTSDGGTSSGAATTGAGSTGTTGGANCTPGAQMACSCLGGGQGLEICQSDGAFGACQGCAGTVSTAATSGATVGATSSAASTGSGSTAASTTTGVAASTGSGTTLGTGTSSSTSGSTSGVTASQACTDWATATCTLSSTCTNGWDVATNAGALDSCIALYEANCLDRLSEPVPPSGQSAANTEACAQSLPAESCVDFFGNDPQGSCGAPAGTGVTGDPCSNNAECQSRYCAIAAHALCGTCQPLPAVGADCSTFTCGEGLICLSGPKTCAPPVDDGGACADDKDCVFGLNCNAGSNICMPTVGPGGACSSSGPLCLNRAGSYCKGGICTHYGLADAGQACGSVAGIQTVCAADGDCTAGSCVAAATDGQACDSVNGPFCLPESTCVVDAGGGYCAALASASCGVSMVSTTTGGSVGTTGGASATTVGSTTSGGITTSGTTGGGTSGGTTGAGTTGGAARVLLVDNDGSTPPSGGPDVSLPLFTGWLNGLGIPYATYLEPSDDSNTSDPLLSSGIYALNQYNTVIWFTADLFGNGAQPTLSNTQQINLTNWLGLGGKTLILFTSELMYDLDQSGSGIAGPNGNAFLTNEVGAVGDEDDPDVFASGKDQGADGLPSIVVTGAASSFTGLSWTSISGESSVSFYWSISKPATGIDILATIQADPNDKKTNLARPVITGNKTIAGTSGNSTVVWVGFTVENLQPSTPDSLSDLFTAIQTYVGSL